MLYERKKTVFPKYVHDIISKTCLHYFWMRKQASPNVMELLWKLKHLYGTFSMPLTSIILN